MVGIGRYFHEVLQDRYDPEHWRRRAEKVRARATQMSNEGSRRVLLFIAESYDLLVKRAELGEVWQGQAPGALSQSD
jgi:hypothetical protein